MEVGLRPGDFVLDGDPALLPQKGGGAPQFPAHVYCGQTAGWIKMALGMEVGPVPVHNVLDGDTAFGPCLLWPNGWMDEDAAWYGSKPRPRPHCTRLGLSSRERGTAAPPLFSAHVYCGHGHPSQLLLSSCLNSHYVAARTSGRDTVLECANCSVHAT